MSLGVGIVVPCYRVSGYIRKAVNSLIAQRHLHWAAVIVDDGSPDDILDPIRDFVDSDRRVQFFRRTNGGVASARNFGYGKLPNDLQCVAFLDGDDEYNDGALHRMAAELEAHPEAGMVHCEPEFIDEIGQVIEERQRLPRWAAGKHGPVRLGAKDRVTPFESVYTLAGIIPSLSLFRRSVYEQTPGYDETFGQHFEDTDVNLQMAIRAPVRYLAEKLVRYRIRSGQSSGDLSRHQTQAEKLYAKWRQMPGLTPEQQAMVNRAEAFRIGPLAAHLGFEAARRHGRNGEWMSAFRFWQGAVRRSAVSRLRSSLR